MILLSIFNLRRVSALHIHLHEDIAARLISDNKIDNEDPINTISSVVCYVPSNKTMKNLSIIT